jgi:hypothetical protein
MTTIKQELEQIREGVVEFSREAEQYADDYRTAAYRAEELLGDIAQAISNSHRATSDIVAELSARLESIQGALASAIREAGALNYAGRVIRSRKDIYGFHL